ncbi:MAG: hypothetical protein HOB38_13780, partial [Deltaproteobacteria bacterium]|nr:hypothetical protein [Deltaproteobacteria bacterium]
MTTESHRHPGLSGPHIGLISPIKTVRNKKTNMNENTHPALLGSLSAPDPSVKLINFSPGPASLPKAVEDEIAASFKRPGLTTLALSHRSPEFLKILDYAT